VQANQAASPGVKPVWLSRNLGQHIATPAGMTPSRGDWIVTMNDVNDAPVEASIDAQASP